MGNIFDDDFVTIWNGTKANELRERDNISVCGSCVFKERCGGCRARSFGITNRLNETDAQCFLHNTLKT